ncbi:MAG TPA: hypothetical protein VN887_17965 [Candidatus Angelobacter sp.]|nr:hypothetical protein [Candidatus Angelobacter sp.]
MSSKSKCMIAAAAMAGLLAGAASRTMASTPVASSGVSISPSTVKASSTVDTRLGSKALVDDTSKTTKHDCKGKNACKGQGGCKTGDNGCKGKNSCKGKGGCKTNQAP